MDWIKVLNKHTIFEYTDLRDSEFVAWIKIMSLTAFMEKIPSREQMLIYTHHKTLDSLEEKLKTHSTTLQDILKKVLKDAQGVILRREVWKNNKQHYRELNKNVSKDVSGDVSHIEKRREEKENKKIKEGGSRTLRKPPQSDGEWMEKLKANPIYQDFNVDILYGKMLVWCDNNGKKPTRRRFVNWLNREERPLQVNNSRNKGGGLRV